MADATAVLNGTVPIVGQPYRVKGITPMALVVCNCGAQEPLQLIGQMVMHCSACRRWFTLVAH